MDPAPERRWIFASYAESLSTKHSVDRRTILQSPWYQERWGDRVTLASDQNVKHEFLNTRRGHMIATSIGGSITGKGGNRIVVDDPHNPMQAESDAQREAALHLLQPDPVDPTGQQERRRDRRRHATAARARSGRAVPRSGVHPRVPAGRSGSLTAVRVSAQRADPPSRARRCALARARRPGRARETKNAARFGGVRRAIPATSRARGRR